MIDYSISFKTAYKNTTFERDYELTDVTAQIADPEVVRGKVNAINASIAGGQASALANLFVSDDYDSQENVGTLDNINTVKIKMVEETTIEQTTTRINDYEAEYDPEAEKNSEEPLNKNT